MLLDSVRELKAELSKKMLVSFSAAQVVASSAMAFAAGPIKKKGSIRPSLAIGVSHKKGKQFQLAVRCQREELMDSREMDQIKAKAGKELDLRFIGRLRKRATPWYQKKVRPLVCGISCGHFHITAGTLGCFVRLKSSPSKLFILSNNHVLADENRAKKGDAILQQGALDGGTVTKNLVAKFTSTVKLKATGKNFIDAAIAEVDATLSQTANLDNLKGLGKIAGLGPEFVDEGTKVAKLGRTTGLTRGSVTAFELDNVVVEYDMGDIRFDNQIEIEGAGTKAFSAGGDSGSLIVLADSREAIALLFAGGDVGGTNGKGLTYANPLHVVLDKLKIKLA